MALSLLRSLFVIVIVVLIDYRTQSLSYRMSVQNDLPLRSSSAEFSLNVDQMVEDVLANLTLVGKIGQMTQVTQDFIHFVTFLFVCCSDQLPSPSVKHRYVIGRGNLQNLKHDQIAEGRYVL